MPIESINSLGDNLGPLFLICVMDLIFVLKFKRQKINKKEEILIPIISLYKLRARPTTTFDTSVDKD